METPKNIADHIFDESKNIKTHKVKENDIVFLNSDLIEVFLKYTTKELIKDTY